MTRSQQMVLLVAAALALSACALVPAGPSTIAPRESATTFTRFRSDDQVCRGWAARKIQDEDALTDSLQSHYDAAYLQCMSAEQAPSAQGVSTYFPPGPPGLLPPPGATPTFTFPTMLLPPQPAAGGQSVPSGITPPPGLMVGPG